MEIVKDDRPHVRLWNRTSFMFIAESRVLGDDHPIDTVATLLRESEQPDAVATVDWHDGSRWSGFVYLEGNHVNVIHHDELNCGVSEDDWTPRVDAWTVLVQVSADQPMPDYREFNAWMSGLCATIGATRDVRDWEQTEPWVVGESRPYGTWRTDHFGLKYLDTKPLANVWQRIEGIASKAMAMVWASIHLVDPLERAGYDVGDLNAQLTDEMVALG